MPASCQRRASVVPASCQSRARKVRARHGASTTFEVGLTKRRMEKFCSFSKGQCLKASRPLRNRNSEMVLNSCKVQQYLQEVTILNEKHNKKCVLCFSFKIVASCKYCCTFNFERKTQQEMRVVFFVQN